MSRPIRTLLRWIKKIPVFARIDWQLYLFRDWWTTRVWKHAKTVNTPFGFKLTSKGHPAYELMRTGQFERDEVRILEHVFGVSDAFIDIGANIGYYCCLALSRDKPVLAFEPQQQNLIYLYQNLETNGWARDVEIYPLALSAKPQLLHLFGASGPSASLIKNWAGYSPRFWQVVATNTLDNILCGRFTGDRLVIKIDVEGAEYQVLRGALHTVARDPKPIWLIEVCFTEYHPGGANPDYLHIFQLFWDHGYICYGANSDCTPVDRKDVDRWIERGTRELDTFNYVFADADVRLTGVNTADNGMSR